MKLYNLYKEVILEAVDIKSVQNAIRNNLGVNIVYQDNSIDSNSGPRYCQILAMGKTSKGNIAIRVYQISGPNLKRNKEGNIQRWKTFRLDRIQQMRPTNFKFYAPPDELFNALGDKTLNIPDNNGMANMAIFSDKNLDSYRERYRNWQSNLDSKQTNKPLKRDRNDNKEKPQPNYPTTKDYQYSNLYPINGTNPEDNEEEIEQIENNG